MERTEEKIFRGEMYYVYPCDQSVGSEQMSGRPAIVVSNDKANEHSPVIEVVYITSRPKKFLPTHADIVSADRPSIAMCEQIHSIDRRRLGRFIAKCTETEMALIDGALCVSLGLNSICEPSKELEKPIEKVRTSELQKLAEDKSALQREVELWKGLYEQLIDKVVQVKKVVEA